MTSATRDLIADLSTTRTRVDELTPHVEKIEHFLHELATNLQKIKQFSDNVSSLDDKLGTTSSILGPLSLLPTVGTACSTAKRGVDATKTVVHPVRTTANTVEKGVKPVRDAAKKAEKAMEDTNYKLEQLKKAAVDMASKLNLVYSCLEKKKNTKLMEASDEYAVEVDPAVEALNTALDKITKLLATVEKKINDILITIADMVDVSAAMNPLYAALGEMDVAFSAINGVLRKKITVPYSFKVKVKIKVKKKDWWKVFYVWEWGWKTDTVNYSFSVQQIINGVNAGVKWVNDQLMKLAEQALNSLGIKMPGIPEIPGIGELKKKLLSMSDIMPSLGIELGDLEVQINSLEALLTTLQARLQEYDITCS